jgi:hypothetical protein
LWLSAAEAPASSDSHTAIILGVIALLSAVMVAVATGIFQLLSARASRTEPSPPAPIPTAGQDVALYERTAVLSQRADDNDERDDVQDRRHEHTEDRLELIEDWIADRDPGWRH